MRRSPAAEIADGRLDPIAFLSAASGRGRPQSWILAEALRQRGDRGVEHCRAAALVKLRDDALARRVARGSAGGGADLVQGLALALRDPFLGKPLAAFERLLQVTSSLRGHALGFLP